MQSEWSFTHMRRSGAAVLLAVFGGLLLAASASAQRQQGPPMPHPRLLIVTPNGGKVGSEVEVVITGTDTDEPQSLLFSQPGIKAELVPVPVAPPPDPKVKQKGRPAAPLASNKFKVTIPANTPLGIHDVRLVSKWGISNPRAFVVGDLAEVQEKEPNNDVDQAQRIELNTTVNGTVSAPTDVDYYVFTGKKGQRVVASCLASSIDSRLQATLELYDKNGRQLAQNRNYSGNDAVLDATLPADGDYYVRLYQFTHTAGTAEYFYRLSVSTAPWIDAIFPAVVEPGKQAKLTIYGRNLPGGQPDPTAVVDGRVLEKATVTVDVPKDPMALQRLAYTGHVAPNGSGIDGFEYRVKNASGTSNPFLLSFARAPVVLDNEKNDSPEQAQAVPVPCEIAGRIEKKRDQDWYTFTAKKDDVYSIELLSDRLGAPTYMEFVLINPATKQVMFESPDNQETLTQFKFMTRTSDPARYQFKAPADGPYQLLVKSQTGDTQAGPRHHYRLRISPSQPDFHLVLMPQCNTEPAGCIVQQGSSQLYDVFVWRTDGFTGDINLSVEGLPAGVTCPPQTIGGGMRQTGLVLTATAAATAWAGEIKVKGTATINGQPVVREARAGSITWPIPQQQNIVTISRMDRNVVLAVRDGAPFSVTATPDKTTVMQGDKITVDLKVARLSPDFKNPLIVSSASPLQPNQPPFLTFNNNQPLNIAGTDGKGVITVNANAIPGTYTLALRADGQLPFAKDAAAKQKQNLTASMAATPVTFTVLPKDLATLAVTPPNAKAKLGESVELVVKVVRKYDFNGEFKVQLVLPPNVKGLTAGEVTIPAGKDEAKLVLKVAPDAPQGNQANLMVKAVAMFNGNVPVNHETKFSINIVK